ncbi:Oxoglutarate/iron-dependent dioxygenase [Trema orientale]|uniref:Oxoglutarate/iron-dependent dioxygenase n=1 Tax=Trema orientale TaxID=63057 RepID=A0A2P5EHH0_TREOI|nr:Oxoglutarate/iron-dependent dioxygenase [Trema orientale]
MASSSPESGFQISHDDHSLMSVQELTKKPLVCVPQQYVRTDREPAATFSNKADHSFPTIPTIDMNNLLLSETADFELEKLHSTCKDWGIFQLVNHGVSPSLLEKLNHEIEAFFKLPMAEKLKYKIRPGDTEGYGSIVRTDDQKRDWGDRMYMITNPITKKKPHLFPELPSSLRTTLESYLVDLEKLAMTLFVLLAKALKIEKKIMEELFEDGMRSMRMNYYPPCPQPELVIGLTPHSDVTGITILHQITGLNGLQIKKDGVWIPVNFIQDAFVVNVGDILEILSNGLYKSIEHRVMANSSKERISLAVFVNPTYESEIGPLASLVSPQNPPLFKKIGMEKYVNDFISRRKLDGKSYLEQMRIKNTNNNIA